MAKEKTTTRHYIKTIVTKRKKDTNKSHYGHVLVIAGSRGLSGAAVLASQASLRAGAGLVTLGVPEDLTATVEAKSTEVMTLPLEQTKNGSIDTNAYNVITRFIEQRKISTLVVGPGLSQDERTKRLVKKIIQTVELPCVLDADAINALTTPNIHGMHSLSRPKVLEIPELIKAKANIIITPHPGELGRLLGVSSRAIQQDRVRYALGFARSNGVVIVLKGHRTLITDGMSMFVNPTGNPGMATAGCGDVLAGIIAGLIAQVQGKSLLRAAVMGAYLHGMAADIAVKDKTEMGLIATDILNYMPRAMKKLAL
ncbi:MAG: NAD(P)H-hydrate dehydratase [bacterium]